MSHATVLIVDITGKRKEADELLKKVDANQKANEGDRSIEKERRLKSRSIRSRSKTGEKAQERSYLFH